MPTPGSGILNQSLRASVRLVSSWPLLQCSTAIRKICQLVAINLTGITVKGSWSGPARLHLVPHVGPPVADLPVRRIIGATHFIADLTLPYGRVVHDDTAETAFVEPPVAVAGA